MYASASQVAAHRTLAAMDDEASAEHQLARAKYDAAIRRLMRYPLDGLPAPSDNDPRLKDAESVGGHIEDIRSWMEKMTFSVAELEETVRHAEDAQRRLEEDSRRIEDEQKHAAAQAEVKLAKQHTEEKNPPDLTGKAIKIEEMIVELDERVTDLEYAFADMREATPTPGDVVFQRLVELGFCKPTPAQAAQLERRGSLEEGEMPFVPPAPPKSNEELTEVCETLGKRLEQCNTVIETSQQQVNELLGRTSTREKDYNYLAADNASLLLAIKAVRHCPRSSVWLCTDDPMTCSSKTHNRSRRLC